MQQWLVHSVQGTHESDAWQPRKAFSFRDEADVDDVAFPTSTGNMRAYARLAK